MNDFNLIDLRKRPPSERKLISSKGGIASGKKRKNKQIMINIFDLYTTIDDLKFNVKKFHLRNGNINQNHIKIYRYYLKKWYHSKMRYLKHISSNNKAILEHKKMYKYWYDNPIEQINLIKGRV